MKLEKAIAICKKFIFNHKAYNIKQADNLEEAIKVLLQALDDSVPKQELINYTNVALENAKYYLKISNKILAKEEYTRYKNLKNLLDYKVYNKEKPKWLK